MKNKTLRDITITLHMPMTFRLLTDTLCLINEGGIDYWGELSYKEAEDLKAAKEYLTKEIDNGSIEPTFTDSLCFEEILAGILLMGGELNLWDREEDESHTFNFDDFCRGIENYFLSEKDDPDPDNWDACTGDCIAQYIAFGELVYG